MSAASQPFKGAPASGPVVPAGPAGGPKTIWRRLARSRLVWGFGFAWAACAVIGRTIMYDGRVAWSSPWFYLAIAGLTPLFAAGAAAARRLVERPRRRPLPVWRNRPRAFFFDWAAIWLCWTPVWLSGWPGFWCYDAQTAYHQAKAGRLTTAMPPLHTWLATSVQAAVSDLTGHPNHGIAAFIMLQSLVVAAVFAHTLRRLRAWGAPRTARWGALAYFALFPTVALFSLSWARNVPFAAVILALAVALVDALRLERAPRWRWWLVGALALAAIALRRDAIWVLIAFLVLMVVFQRPARRALVAALVTATIAGALLDPLVYRGLMGLGRGTPVASFSVPLQQLARVYVSPEGSLTRPQRQLLESIVAPRFLVKYRPQLADPLIMGAGSRVEAGTKRFLKLWARVGLENPAIYADAFAANTVQGWLPGAIIDAYSGFQHAPQYSPRGTSYFCYDSEAPGLTTPKGPAFIRDAYAAFSNRSRAMFRAPVLAWLWSPGTYLWLFAFGAALTLAWARRGRAAPPAGRPPTGAAGASAFLPVALLALATCLPIFLGPGMLVRYFLQLFYCAPLVATFLIDPRVFAPVAVSDRLPQRPGRASHSQAGAANAKTAGMTR
jgi:hypothetical protein